MRKEACLAAYLVLVSLAPLARAGASDFPNPLAPDSGPRVSTLPEKYPTGWAFLNFPYNRIELRNVGSDSREVRGELQGHDSTDLLQASGRPEIYTLDTVWSRGARGTRTDFISVYDTKTLDAIGEIVLPAPRALISPMSGNFVFTDHERLGLVFNFRPKSTITVVDFSKRKVLGEIDIPGCSLAYPTGERGFSTLCSSGTLLSVRLGADGKELGRSESKKFNDLDKDPLFTESTSIGGVQYFDTMLGRIQPIDMSTDAPKILASWSLLSAQDEANHWRPSGWQTISTDEKSTLYVLMQPDAHEGTHKDPGTEVWAYDVTTQKRLRRMRLVRPGATIALTHASDALLLVQAEDRVDVYDPLSGALIRSLGVPGLSNHMMIQPVR